MRRKLVFALASVTVAATAMTVMTTASGSPLHVGSAKAVKHAQAHANVPGPTGSHEATYVPLTPCRIIDTGVSGGPLISGKVRTFHVGGTAGFPAQGGHNGGCIVPAFASAVTVSLETVNTTHPGYVRTWAATTTEPGTASTLIAPGAGTLTAATVPLHAGLMSAKAQGGNTRFIVDVTGYYAPRIYAQVAADSTVYDLSRLTTQSHPFPGIWILKGDTDLDDCIATASSDAENVADAFTQGSNVVVVTSTGDTDTDEFFGVEVTC